MKVNWNFLGRGNKKNLKWGGGGYGYFLELHVNDLHVVEESILSVLMQYYHNFYFSQQHKMCSS